MSIPPEQVYLGYIGVDIAAADFTAAILLPGGQPQPEPKPFPQTEEGFKQFVSRLQKLALAPEHQLVVMEATGPYWLALALHLSQAGFKVSVTNPAQVHYFAKAQLKRAKSDKLDAKTLAQFGAALTPKVWVAPPQFYHELRQRLTQRDQLLKLAGQLANQLHALLVSPVVVGTVKSQLEELIATVTAQIKQLDKELQSLTKFDLTEWQVAGEPELEVDQLWKKNIALLRTIPGIGPLTAAWLVVVTLNFTTCATVEALVHYAGLAPMEHSSGTSVRGRPQIGHSGNGRLRSLLFLTTLSAVRFNPLIRAFWERLRNDKHKPVKVVRCACARKLLHLAFAIVHSGRPFDPAYHSPPPQPS